MKEYKLKVNGNEYNVSIESVEGSIAKLEVNGSPYIVELEGTVGASARPAPIRSAAKTTTAPESTVSKPSAPVSAARPSASEVGGGAIKSPLPGVVIEVNVKVGDEIKVGQKILVLEAMKMENNINSDRDGKVVEVKVGKGDSVLEGADLIIIG